MRGGETLTLGLGRSVVGGVDALGAEEVLRLQDENQRAPSEQRPGYKAAAHVKKQFIKFN